MVTTGNVTMLTDEGYVRDRDTIPVTEINIGTDVSGDVFTLGSVECNRAASEITGKKSLWYKRVFFFKFCFGFLHTM